VTDLGLREKEKSEKRTQNSCLQNLEPDFIYQNFMFQQKLLQRDYYSPPPP
jgi:hypothetical protein